MKNTDRVAEAEAGEVGGGEDAEGPVRGAVGGVPGLLLCAGGGGPAAEEGLQRQLGRALLHRRFAGGMRGAELGRGEASFGVW